MINTLQWILKCSVLFFNAYTAYSNDFMIHYWVMTYSWRNTGLEFTSFIDVNKYYLSKGICCLVS